MSAYCSLLSMFDEGLAYDVHAQNRKCFLNILAYRNFKALQHSPIYTIKEVVHSTS